MPNSNSSQPVVFKGLTATQSQKAPQAVAKAVRLALRRISNPEARKALNGTAIKLAWHIYRQEKRVSGQAIYKAMRERRQGNMLAPSDKPRIEALLSA